MERGKKYFIVNKPYGVLAQFSDKEGRPTLSSLYNFPKDVYPVGRLDMDSEGLLIVTNDKEIVDKLLNPKYKHNREYYVQVEGVPDEKALASLSAGVIIEGRKTLPCRAVKISDPGFAERVPPVRVRKTIPTSWLSITLVEGKNRQVRKMTAAAGHPTLRLVRVAIEKLKLGSLGHGEVKEIGGGVLYGLLF